MQTKYVRAGGVDVRMTTGRARRRGAARLAAALSCPSALAVTMAATAATASLLAAPRTATAFDTENWILGGTGTTGGGTGNWNVPGNWSAGVIPDVGDANGKYNAQVGNGGTVQITANQAAGDVNAGTNGNGFYNMAATGSTLTVNGWFRYGTVAGVTGGFTNTGGTVLVAAGGAQANIGELGTGFYNASVGAFQFTSGRVDLGANGAAAVGTINLSGTATFNTGTAFTSVGGSGTGTLNVSGSAVYVSGDVLNVGDGTGSKGQVLLSGGNINSSNLFLGKVRHRHRVHVPDRRHVQQRHRRPAGRRRQRDRRRGRRRRLHAVGRRGQLPRQRPVRGVRQRPAARVRGHADDDRLHRRRAVHRLLRHDRRQRRHVQPVQRHRPPVRRRGRDGHHHRPGGRHDLLDGRHDDR